MTPRRSIARGNGAFAQGAMNSRLVVISGRRILAHGASRPRPRAPCAVRIRPISARQSVMTRQVSSIRWVARAGPLVSAIGQCLKDQYDAVATPIPSHLAALVKQLETQK